MATSDKCPFCNRIVFGPAPLVTANTRPVHPACATRALADYHKALSECYVAAKFVADDLPTANARLDIVFATTRKALRLGETVRVEG